MNLTLNACAGQVLVAGFPAGDPPAALARMAAAGKLGGYILFRRNLGSPREIAELTAQLSASVPADLPVFIGVDQEGGRVARLGAPVVCLPPMRVLGDLNDTDLTRAAAELLGRQLALLGFNLDFAPVLDVDTNPANPVIGDRSFGREAPVVIRQAGAFAEGLARAGITACGKHFPGHGDTAQDSHLQLPRLTHDRERLARIEVAPFAALAPFLPSIMTAHVVFEAIDPSVPATLSRAVIRGSLRGELGYQGLVFSDDLEMKAISDHYGTADAACAAIAAGCDSLLICSRLDDVLLAHEALTQRAEHDAAFATQLREAAARSLALRARLGSSAAPPSQVDALLRAEQPESIEERIAHARDAASARA